jgi:hypothetical protein
MAKKHSALVKLNKDIAEGLFGHSRGRPTISRRAGRHIGRALGIGVDAGTDIFHVGLLVASLTMVAKAAK